MRISGEHWVGYSIYMHRQIAAKLRKRIKLDPLGALVQNLYDPNDGEKLVENSETGPEIQVQQGHLPTSARTLES